MKVGVVTDLRERKEPGGDLVSKKNPKIPTSQLTYEVCLMSTFIFFMNRVKILILQCTQVQKLAS